MLLQDATHKQLWSTTKTASFHRNALRTTVEEWERQLPFRVLTQNWRDATHWAVEQHLPQTIYPAAHYPAFGESSLTGHGAGLPQRLEEDARP